MSIKDIELINIDPIHLEWLTIDDVKDDVKDDILKNNKVLNTSKHKNILYYIGLGEYSLTVNDLKKPSRHKSHLQSQFYKGLTDEEISQVIGKNKDYLNFKIQDFSGYNYNILSLIVTLEEIELHQKKNISYLKQNIRTLLMNHTLDKISSDRAELDTWNKQVMETFNGIERAYNYIKYEYKDKPFIDPSLNYGFNEDGPEPIVTDRFNKAKETLIEVGKRIVKVLTIQSSSRH